ncbi:MAG: Sir2 family NAD-dependent protein deacetylase, partial [Solirubrobacteraceae bacterium]|nr:Sir2 family NAD-dependent protein deacetylase [Solirubrobacteraceae bacterium]
MDGLHRRSGVKKEGISELHGNCFISVCWNCGADYPSDEEVHGGLNPPKTCKECHPRTPHFCHCTGKRCSKCQHMLKDSIIHFGESLPVDALVLAEEHAKLADLCIVLGSSLTVSPANGIPKTVLRRKEDGSKGKVVIVNLQKTDLDKHAAIRIWGKTDEVIAAVQAELAAVKPRSAAPLGAEEEDDGNSAADDLSATITHRVATNSTNNTNQQAVAPTQAPRQFRVGNKHQILTGRPDGNAHQWTMFVQHLSTAALPSTASSSDTPVLTAVTYYLHPTFSPPEVTVSASRTVPPHQNSFEMSRVGWGTFPVGVKLHFSNGTSAF